jgi:hypothetical protein
LRRCWARFRERVSSARKSRSGGRDEHSAAPGAATKPDVTADVADDADSSKRPSTDYADYADCPERTRNSERKTADERRWRQIESRIEACRSSGRTEPDSCVVAGGIYRRLPRTRRPQDRCGGEKQRRSGVLTFDICLLAFDLRALRALWSY